MNVINIGTDIIEVDRIESMIQKHGDTFFGRVYTEAEVHYCSQRAASSQHYAGRWAAKEAALKVLGTGWAKGIRWTELEVEVLPSGQPILQLNGKAQQIATELGIQKIHVSISHTRQYAVAYCVGVGG